MTSNPIIQKTSRTLTQQVCAYDDCFVEFLDAAHNGQKHVQAALLRESFKRFQAQAVGIQIDAPTAVLDVSCGPGEYSTAWTSQAAEFLPHGMEFYCTDFPGGVCKDTGEKYPVATARKIQEAAASGRLKLTGKPIPVEANLFSGDEAIIPQGRSAHVVHWSHSGYHVRDALGAKKDDPREIGKGLNNAVDKIWAALDKNGLLFSVHQTGDVSDGIPSEMFPISKKYLGVLDDVPARVAKRIKELGGYAAAVIFATPLKFPELADARWDSLKDANQWDYSDSGQARALRLLGFIAYDFSDPTTSGLKKLFERDKLSAFVDDYKTLVRKNSGHINVKCAFQMVCKSPELAHKIDAIAGELKQNMSDYMQEMEREMRKAAGHKK